MNIAFSTKSIRIFLIIAFSMATLIAVYVAVTFVMLSYALAYIFDVSLNVFETIWQANAHITSILFSVLALVGVVKYQKKALLFGFP